MSSYLIRVGRRKGVFEWGKSLGSSISSLNIGMSRYGLMMWKHILRSNSKTNKGLHTILLEEAMNDELGGENEPCMDFLATAKADKRI